MKQTTTQVDSNQDPQTQQRTFHRMLQLHYNTNLITQANSLKRCIHDIDTTYDNRIIRKTDKVWVEANLDKIFEKAAHKLQKNLLTKNQYIRNTLEMYCSQFQQLSKQKITQIRSSFQIVNQKQPKRIKKLSTLPTRNNSFSIQNVNSQPSCSQNNSRKTFTSKRVFRVRQFKNSLQDTINNYRYIERLEKVKLESSFAQFFFKKQPNPEEPKPVQIQKMYFDKIKAMTNIRWNFNPSSQNSQSFTKPHISRQSSKPKSNNYLGFEVRRQSFYKPKSKCQSRNNKIFLNF